jgi:hypothetical protein
MKRAALFGAAMLIACFASFGVAHALGTQNHTTSNIRHGCPLDPGCTGSTNYYGNYIRTGYNRCDPLPSGCGSDNDMDTSTSNVYHSPTGGFRIGSTCGNCQRTDVYYSTGNVAECYYYTTHSTSGPSMSSANHYTESAGSQSCPI